MIVSVLYTAYYFFYRFRVVDETFVDTTPTGPDGTSVETSDNSDTDSKKSPYTIVVCNFFII